MKKGIYNVFKNNRGQVIPKAPVIRNSEEIRKWVEENIKVNNEINPKGIKNNEEWFFIDISASLLGNLYFYPSTCKDFFFKKYIEDNDNFKIFDYDIESFKKYLKWASNLPRSIVNNKL